jgi:hypothetical protein
MYRKAQEPPVLTPDLKKIPRKPEDYRKPGYLGRQEMKELMQNAH